MSEQDLAFLILIVFAVGVLVGWAATMYYKGFFPPPEDEWDDCDRIA